MGGTLPQTPPSGWREFALKDGGTVSIRRKEVAEYVTGPGYTLVKTKAGSVYRVLADYPEVQRWVLGEDI